MGIVIVGVLLVALFVVWIVYPLPAEDDKE